jgi:nucleotidyltransferase/DNA polymerase involved in DNA repair
LRRVSDHFEHYQRLGTAVIKVINNFTPLVERISIDEAFAGVAAILNECRSAFPAISATGAC